MEDEWFDGNAIQLSETRISEATLLCGDGDIVFFHHIPSNILVFLFIFKKNPLKTLVMGVSSCIPSNFFHHSVTVSGNFDQKKSKIPIDGLQEKIRWSAERNNHLWFASTCTIFLCGPITGENGFVNLFMTIIEIIINRSKV